MDDPVLGYQTRGMEEFAGGLAGSRCIRGWMRGWVEGRSLVSATHFFAALDRADLIGRTHGPRGRDCCFYLDFFDCYPGQRTRNERIKFPLTARNDPPGRSWVYWNPDITRCIESTGLTHRRPTRCK
jgi:hypothetical protein